MVLDPDPKLVLDPDPELILDTNNILTGLFVADPLISRPGSGKKLTHSLKGSVHEFSIIS